MTMPMLKTVKIRSYEAGRYFRDGEFKSLYAYWTTHREVTTEVIDARAFRRPPRAERAVGPARRAGRGGLRRPAACEQ